MKATGFEAIMQKQNASEAHIQQVKGDLNGWSDRLEVGVAQVLAPQDVGLPVFRIIMRDTPAAASARAHVAQAKKVEVEGYKKKVDEMEDVANLQTEVADLDRCIAWCEASDLRAEVHQLTAATEEQLPKEVEEVGAASRVASVL